MTHPLLTLGSNNQYQLVDERTVGLVPKRLDYAEAAALPLTGFTAWEALFDRLKISLTDADAGKWILVIGNVGGVCSIAIRLAKRIARLNVVATASRPESIAWAEHLGADRVVDHRKPLDEELKAIDVPQVDYILCLDGTDQHWPAMVEVIAPQGRICSIVETTESVDLDSLKSNSAGFVWEFIFTRSMYKNAGNDRTR